MVQVENSVLEEEQPVSEQRSLYVDWKGIPTAGRRSERLKLGDVNAVRS
jgi:hypothetical protein